MLRGAGAALALPWLESLEPRLARAQTLAPRRRFVAIYFPNGVVTSWTPQTIGSGSAWAPSPAMAPLAAVKSSATVLTNVGNYGPFGGVNIQPSNGYTTGAFLTCAKAQFPGLSPVSTVTTGTSVDQVIAQSIAGTTPIDSLQLGLSTLDSYCDGVPCPCSRSISWATPTQPLGKVIDPQAVFDRLFASMPGGDAGAAPRPQAGKSVLDFVLGHATSVQQRLSVSDRARMDQFMTSVRSVEASLPAVNAACTVGPRPPESYQDMNVPPDYNRDVHANLMIDLMIMAMQCDMTRVISHMMDDARSDFVYDFLNLRTFTATGSTLTNTPLTGTAYGLCESGDDNDGYATINYWFVEKLALLCQKMDAIDEGPNGSILDQSVVWMSSNFHGGNHDALDLPIIYVGSGGGRLKVDQHIDFATTARGAEALANVYLTFLKSVFDLSVATFGVGYPTGTAPPGQTVVPEILV